MERAKGHSFSSSWNNGCKTQEVSGRGSCQVQEAYEIRENEGNILSKAESRGDKNAPDGICVSGSSWSSDFTIPLLIQGFV